MSALSILWEAIQYDGQSVLHFVITRLYEGKNLRPDVYFQTNPYLRQKNYKHIFDYNQRGIIEGSGSATEFNINTSAESYDVSLLAHLVEYTCGLAANDPLLKKVHVLRNLRNIVSHSTEETCEDIKEKLRNLLDIFKNIIEDVEDRTGEDLGSVKKELESKINKRLADVSGMSVLDKVAVGGAVAIGGAAAIGAGYLLYKAFGSGKKEGDKK